MRLRVLVLALVLFVPACGTDLAPKAPAGVTPQVAAKFYATYAQKDLDVIRDAANDMANTTPPIITGQTLLVIVDWHEALAKVVHEAPSGWQATVLTGLEELRKKLAPSDAAKFKPYIDAAKTFIQEAK